MLTGLNNREILAKSFPVKKLSAAVVGFLIGGGSLAYRLDLTWKLIDWRRGRTAAVPGSIFTSDLSQPPGTNLVTYTIDTHSAKPIK